MCFDTAESKISKNAADPAHQKAAKKSSWAKKYIWAEKSSFFKIALKRLLTLPKARSRKMRQIPQNSMGLQNKTNPWWQNTEKYNFGPNVVYFVVVLLNGNSKANYYMLFLLKGNFNLKET